MSRAPLTCPKCQGEMITTERSGVLIEECRDCRGLFLDRGEIERLIGAGDPGEGHGRGSHAPSARRAQASRAIADILVLVAAEPQPGHRRHGSPASRAGDTDAT